MGWIKNCKETSMLVTQSLDRRLSWREGFGMRIHLAICENCSRFARQMRQIREWLAAGDETAGPGLSEEGRKRIARNLQDGD